jgi:hypothetical protein
MHSFTEEEIIKLLVDRWPSPLVARSESGRFSGGVVSPRYMANLDSLGQGPAQRVRFAGKVAYSTEVFAKWLADRMVK